MALRQDLIRIPAMLAYVVQGPRQRLRQLSYHVLRAGLRVQGVGDDTCDNAALRQAGRQRGVVPLLACQDKDNTASAERLPGAGPRSGLSRASRSGGACQDWIQSASMHKHS